MSKNVAYNADFNILATITAPLFKSTDPNIKLDTNATLSLANLMASHINRRYKAVPTKVGAATVRLDSAYGSAPIQEFVKEKVANGYEYYTDGSVYNLLKLRDYARVRFLNGGCEHDYLKTIDSKIDDQHSLWRRLDNVNEFSKPSLKMYDAKFLADFAANNLSIDPFKFLENVPIFEIEDMHLRVYMPPVDELGKIQFDNNLVGDVTVSVEITVITVDMSIEDFYNHAKTVFATVWTSGIEYEHEKIDNLGKVDTRCTIVKKIEETSNGTKLYGYGDVPKSPVVKASDLLFTVSNKEFARRLYCGVVWTHDALIFAETYYQYRD